ncbi:MAG TPA: IclR family transcriptional regulator, partial [Candidatus Yaniella excrementigallinarum]|nr:IclR family transcriptional regulator [Candidatus Yaniella excrementigallinarum]
MSPETAEHLINSGQVQLQPGWTMAEVRQRLNTVHQRGYAVNLQETFDDEIGIAAPVYDHRDKVVAVVLVAAPAYRVDDNTTATLIEQCLATAATISTRMGRPDTD